MSLQLVRTPAHESAYRELWARFPASTGRSVSEIEGDLVRNAELVFGAVRLGFADDVRHWRDERVKLCAELREARRRAEVYS